MFRIFLIIALVVLAGFFVPSYAYRVKNSFIWNEIGKAEVVSVEDALEIKIKFDKMLMPVYVSNLNCHEYTRVYTLQSSGGNTYVRQRQRTIRKSREVTEYINKLFEQYKDNIYFKPNGLGLYGNFVGEFYIGQDSLSRHLIDKGYCDFVQ